MPSRLTLNRMDVFGLLAVGITSFLFMGAALHAARLYSSVQSMSASDLVLGCSGWIIATFGPLGMAVLFWRRAKELRNAWALHVLMLPLALAMFKLGSFMMLYVTGTPDFDDTIGGPVIQALALILLAIIGYYSAVLHSVLKRRSTAANVR